MKKSIKVLFLLSCFVVLSSCKNEKSLQSYLVESQEKSGFIAIDIPTTFLELKQGDITQEVEETLKSIRKINVVALPYKGNEDAYETEKNAIKEIFKDNDSYTTLMNMKAKGMNVNLYYMGETESIDEIIAFGYGKEAGVGIARLLGEDMNPSKIMAMMNEIKLNPENMNLEQFSAIFSSEE